LCYLAGSCRTSAWIVAGHFIGESRARRSRRSSSLESGQDRSTAGVARPSTRKSATVSVRNHFIGAYDPNLVVGKLHRNVRNVIFGHVTFCTVLARLGTGQARMVGRWFRIGAVHVTTKTFIVVRGGLALQRTMWIVACDAGQASIALTPTAAVLQSIGW